MPSRTSWQNILNALMNFIRRGQQFVTSYGLGTAISTVPTLSPTSTPPGTPLVLEKAEPVVKPVVEKGARLVLGSDVLAGERPTPPTTPAATKGTPTQETKSGTTVSSAVIQAPAKVSAPARSSETTLPGQVSPTATATEITKTAVGETAKRPETAPSPARIVSSPPTGAGLIPTPPTPVGLGGGTPTPTEAPRVGGITATPPIGAGTIPTPPSPVRSETVIPISQIIQQLLASEPERKMAELPLPEEITERGKIRPRRFEEVLSELITR
jgi:hypothetical protein